MKHASLSNAFIVRVLLILLVCQGGLFAWSYVQEKQSLEDSLQQKITVVSRLMVNASAKGLTEFDFTYLGLLMDEMLKDEDFVGMSLKDETGFEAMERHKTVKGVHFKQVAPVNQGSKPLGHLEITYSRKRVDHLLRERVMLKAGIQTGILVVIALVIYSYFRSRIARRITTIERNIARMTAGDLTARIDDHASDELGAISSGVDLLGHRLAESVSRIAAFSERVAMTARDLDDAFATTQTALSHQHDATEEISRAISSATTNQTQISLNARRLLDFSRGNAAAVAENLAVSEGIAERIDSLHSGMNDAHDKVLAIDISAKGVADLAIQAARAVENAVSSAATINASFNDIERIVVESSRLSEQTTQVITDKGIASVAETQESMTRIFELSESLRRTITKLGDESKDIAKILAVISEITDKTKLLSLNASIIAAQAGEHGRGFAVVANEMKLLSDKTTQSTAEIVAILGTIHHDIADAVRETGEANKIVQEGSRVVTHAGIALQEVLSASRESQDTVACIRQATDLQQEKLKQVVDALNKLRDVNFAVSQASNLEESNINTVRKSIGELRDAMDHVRVATEQQVASMQDMMRNIEAATGRTSEISNAVHEAQQVNGAICASLSDVVGIGRQTAEELAKAAVQVDSVNVDVEKLRAEMQQFKL